METRIPDLTELVRAAKAAGAAGVELLHEEWLGHRMRLERGTVVAEDEPTGARLSVRIWLEGGREGQADGALAAGRALIEQALLAAADEPGSAIHGPVGRLASVQRGLGIDDRRFEAIEREDRLEVLTTAERAIRSVDRRLVPGPCWYEDRRTQRTFASSRGVELEERDTVFRAGATATVAGEGRAIECPIEGRSFSSIASLPFGNQAGTIALSVLPRGDRPTGPVRVLLEPEATAQLVAALALGFTSARIRSGGFFLAPNADGSPVVDPRLHLLDDGTLAGGLRTASFDDRGVAPVPLPLLREGRVDGTLLGVDEARLADRRPTGHELGGRLAPRNLALRVGGRSVNVILAELDQLVVVVHQLPDLSGFDLQTGRFEAPVAVSLYQGARHVGGHPASILRGDLKDVLNRVVEVASNTDRIGHVDAPAMVVDGFELA